MSELINNSEKRKEILKHMILELHSGQAPEQVKQRLVDLLQYIPYDDVVEVEQELISEGLPVEEVLKLCDVHTQVLDGHIDQSGAAPVPEGHPVDVLKQENRALEAVAEEVADLLKQRSGLQQDEVPKWLVALHGKLNALMDVDKHYLRKEYLLFPFLEALGITGPPKVMWGKHDEIRELLKGSIEILNTPEIEKEDLDASALLVLIPAVKQVFDMTVKEEEILLPMAMDALSDSDWYQISKQSLEFGFCLYDPPTDWLPEGTEK